MKRSTGLKWFLSGVIGAAAPLVAHVATAQSPPVREVVEKQGDAVLFLVDEAAEDEAKNPRSLAERVVLLADTALPSEYWLGISLGELPEVSKQQLGVESGLVVADVMEGSPAAKAEIKKHDILIKAGEAPLKEPADLIKVVDASKGKEIRIVIVRGGKDRTITVAPVKRSEEQARVEGKQVEVRGPSLEFRSEIKQLEQALQSLKDKAGDGSLGLWFAKPAIVGPKGDVFKATELFLKDFKGDFPKDLSVRITKEGDQPTKIRVNRGDRGDQEWGGEKLSEFPDDVRQHVQKLLERMLAPGSSAAATRTLRLMPGGKVEGEVTIAQQQFAYPKPPTASAKPTAPTPPQVAWLHATRVESGGVEAKLDAIMKKLDQLSKEVDELRSRSPEGKR